MPGTPIIGSISPAHTMYAELIRLYARDHKPILEIGDAQIVIEVAKDKRFHSDQAYFINLGLIMVPVDKQRQGIGTKALELLCEYLDKFQVRCSLVVHVITYNGHMGKDEETLYQWYLAHGWESEPRGKFFMNRLPKARED